MSWKTGRKKTRTKRRRKESYNPSLLSLSLSLLLLRLLLELSSLLVVADSRLSLLHRLLLLLQPLALHYACTCTCTRAHGHSPRVHSRVPACLRTIATLSPLRGSTASVLRAERGGRHGRWRPVRGAHSTAHGALVPCFADRRADREAGGGARQP